MKRIYFKKGCFVTATNSIYDFDIPEDDRFYQYITPYIDRGGFDGVAKIKIDKVFIKDGGKTFFDNDRFTLQARLMTEEIGLNNSIVKAHSITIDGVSLDTSTSTAQSYKNGVWEITLGELIISYHSEITINEK